MSLNDLVMVPREDRDLFLRWMVKATRADGILDPTEILTLNQLVAAWDLTEADLARLHQALRHGPSLGDDAPPGFLDPRTPYLLIRELIRLGHEDGTYSQSERDTVREVAARYRVPLKRVEALETWVLTEVTHSAQGRALLDPVRR